MRNIMVESKAIGICFVTEIIKSGNGFQGKIDMKDCEFHNLEVGNTLKVDFKSFKRDGVFFDLGFSYPLLISKKGKKFLYFRIPKDLIDLYGFESGDRLEISISARLIKRMKY